MPSNRDLIVIGTSAGGVQAVPVVLAGLPADLPASLLVVQHQLAGSVRYLVDILRRHSKLPVDWAEQGARVERGHVYVAPPDYHTLLTDGHLRLDGGPREAYSRPSIDRAFRSAAELYGPRAIGVLLTGMLEDGAAGLAAIRAAGGRAVIQDPASAAFPDLPANALRKTGADRTVPLGDIAATLVELVAEDAPAPPADWHTARDALVATLTVSPDGSLEPTLTCAECAGPMHVVGVPGAREYRCARGHTVTESALSMRAADDIESALWLTVRAIHERTAVLDILAHDAEVAGDQVASAAHKRLRREFEDAIDQLRRFALDLDDRTRPPPDQR